MNKELIQDIKQPKRRLAEILPKGPKGGGPGDTIPVYPTSRGRGRGRRIGWFLIVLIILGLPFVYFASQFLAEATVIVTPKETILTLDATLQSVALPVETETDLASKIGYQTMTVEAIEQTTVAASEKKMVSERASGRIIIVNRYSPRPQKLVVRTRFQTVDGRIYRLLEETTVPGYVLTDGKMTGGEIEVAVQADKPGAESNGEVKDLNIPSFKGDQRFDKITARAVTVMSGGFVGERLVISATVRETAEKELVERLRATLENEAAVAVPDGFLTFQTGQFYKFQSRIKSEESETDNLTLETDGELTALMFSRRELSRRLAAAHFADYDGAEVKIVNFDQLEFYLLNKESFDPLTAREANIRLVGQARLVWQFDSSALKKALAGVSKSDYQTVFFKFPSIVRVEVMVQPPWLKRFPSDPAKITIQTVGVDPVTSPK